MKRHPISNATGSRIRRRPEEIEALLDEYRSSGLSQKAFAAARGVKFSTFTSWLQRFKTRDVASCSGAQRLIRVRVDGASVGTPGLLDTFELVLPSGIVLRVPPSFDEPSLRQLLGALAERC